MKISLNRIANKLFILLLLFTCIPYIYLALFNLINKNVVFWSFGVSALSISGLPGSIPHFKDVFCCMLFFIVISIHSRRNKKVFFGFSFILLWGVVLFLISSVVNDYSIIEIFQHIVAGVREYLYIFTAIMFLNIMLLNSGNNRVIIYSIIKIHYFILALQTIIAFWNLLIFGNVNMAGTGGLRIVGAFGNSGSLGYYTVGAAFFSSVICSYKEICGKFSALLQFLMILFLSFASGMRLAQIIVIMFVIITLIDSLYNIIHLNRKTIMPTIGVLLLLLVPIFLQIIISRTARGGLSLSAVSRVDTILFLLNQKLFFLFFGSGIGVGTNAIILFQTSDSRIYDGTFSMIVGQFGVVGLILFVLFCCHLFHKILSKSGNKKIYVYAIIISLMLVFISGNFFEQYSLVLWTATSIYFILTVRDSPAIDTISGRLSYKD